MDPSEHGRSRSTRRRLVVGLLAGAAIAVPGIAIASAGGSSDVGAPPAGKDDLPSLWMQDDRGERGPSEGRRHHDRDCPKEGRGGKGGSSGSGSSGRDTDQRRL